MAKAPVQTVKQAKKSGAQDNRTPNSRVEYSNPEAVVKFTLHTQEGIRVQSRNFNIISQALFNLTNNSRFLERLGTKYSGAIERTLKAVNEVIDMPEKELENNIAILNRAVKEEEERSSLNEVGYTHPKEHEVRIRTPQALRVIRIIQNFDKLHQIIDTLWLNNCFNQDEVEEFKSRLHNLIRDLAASLKRHAQASADELNQANGRAAEKELAGSTETEPTQVDQETKVLQDASNEANDDQNEAIKRQA
ncbi:hypothetical protein NMD21_26105 (plasmid) [Citrobacter portucalensis]|uniref:hypothetical protein n=1 Tax=Citrobacter portucalensis TaxID=1639133 RepID=UPI00351CE4B0